MTKPYRIKKLIETVSTNDDAKAAAIAGEAEGLAVWALKQSAGRGRHGRNWESPEGNLFVSILVRPGCEMKQAGHYGFIASLAMRDVVRSVLPNVPVTLKWPNDVLVQGKKIGGILLESSPGSDGRTEWLVAGIGMNVAHHPENALYPTTSLRAAGATPPPLPELLDRLLDSFFYWQNSMKIQDLMPIREAWLAAAEKGHITVKLPGRTMEGDFAGLDNDGNLILRAADGKKQTVVAGDVFFTPVP